MAPAAVASHIHSGGSDWSSSRLAVAGEHRVHRVELDDEPQAACHPVEHLRSRRTGDRYIHSRRKHGRQLVVSPEVDLAGGEGGGQAHAEHDHGEQEVSGISNRGEAV